MDKSILVITVPLGSGELVANNLIQDELAEADLVCVCSGEDETEEEIIFDIPKGVDTDEVERILTKRGLFWEWAQRSN